MKLLYPVLRIFHRDRLLRKLVLIVILASISIIVFGSVANRHRGKAAPFEVEKENLGKPWLRFPEISGYYNGLQSLVSVEQHAAEFPRGSRAKSDQVQALIKVEPIPSQKHDPYPKYSSAEYLANNYPVEPCFLDSKNTIRPPSIYSYQGLPRDQPRPIFGSHDLLNISGNVCFDRLSKLGPYGFGQMKDIGITGEEIDTTAGNTDQPQGHIDYGAVDGSKGVNWGQAQNRCYEANKARFIQTSGTAAQISSKKALSRTAVVIRSYVGFEWTDLMIVNVRGIISELAIQSGGEYTVHILLHVKDAETAFWKNQTAADVVKDNIPAEFQDITTIWAPRLMEMFYTTPFGDPFENSSGQGVHGSYRGLHMSLQWFAQKHPEYDFFWNWEVDIRYTGHYYELFDRLSKWGREQKREGLWERNAKYYIPSLHGSYYDDFAKLVEIQNAGNEVTKSYKSKNGSWPGAPLEFPGRQWLDQPEQKPPPSCSPDSDQSLCGIGEDADLITFNPMFDPDTSGWILEKDITGYDTSLPIPPRRNAIVAAGRFSKKLLKAMHEEMIQFGHSAFTEMFPPTMAFHHGLKGVYAPHPVYFERKWPLEEVEKNFNGGKFGSAGGNASSPYHLDNEHNFHGTTWYYNAAFANKLWRRWLGFEHDGQGGKDFEDKGTGRMCLPGMLLHPIKWEYPPP